MAPENFFFDNPADSDVLRNLFIDFEGRKRYTGDELSSRSDFNQQQRLLR
jgi:hypothetical protein